MKSTQGQQVTGGPRSWKIWCHVWWNGIKRGHLLKSELACIISMNFLRPAFPRLSATVFSSYTLNFLPLLRSASIPHCCFHRAPCMPAPPTRNQSSRRRARTSKTQVGPKCPLRHMEKLWDSGVYRLLWKHHRDCWIRVHWGACVKDVYGRVGETYVGWSAGVNVREGCTVDVACVCERGFQSYVLLPIFLGFVACLTIGYSGINENDAAWHWVLFRFSYKQDAVQFEVCSCDSFHLLGSKWVSASRTKEIFGIIIGFPDSIGALYDLQVCHPNFFSSSYQTYWYLLIFRIPFSMSINVPISSVRYENRTHNPHSNNFIP